jgi:glutamine phosphoribosylpyrophosphate amidotransferase
MSGKSVYEFRKNFGEQLAKESITSWSLDDQLPEPVHLKDLAL